jgi:hypothetical protein
VKYEGFNEDGSGAIFLIQKKPYMNAYHLGIDLRYYPSYQGFESTRSGAAVFRPATNHSLRYCGGKGPSEI